MEKEMSMYAPEYQYNTFERIVANIFKKAGYDVEVEVRCNDVIFDIVAQKEEEKYAIEVKYLSYSMERMLISIERSVEKIVYNAEHNGMTPILVVSSVINDSVREELSTRYEHLIIIDAANLMYVAQNDQKTYTEVASILPGITDAIKPKEIDDQHLNLCWLEHQDEYQSIIRRLKDCPVGIENASKFEDVCIDALKYIFSNDLALWKSQICSNMGLYRFDLICRIKDDIAKSFWKVLEQHLHTKYVVFEFKNYTEKIKQSQIYTTEKYLYSKALRTVGIIISANGADENAKRAAAGVFRETGKLILLFDKYDLCNMCKRRNDNDDPSNDLMDRLDQMLSELEK